MQTISDRIKLIRQTATGQKLTQEEFGKSLGVSRGVVTNWEDAENRLPNGVPESVLKLICSTYHVNLNWLKDGVGEMMLQFTTDDLVEKYMAGESELTKSIMKAFAKLPDEEWHKLRDLIEKIKREGD